MLLHMTKDAELSLSMVPTLLCGAADLVGPTDSSEVGERFEGEGTFAGSPFELCWLASFLRFCGGGHGVPVERGCPFFYFVPPCDSDSFERNFNALI